MAALRLASRGRRVAPRRLGLILLLLLAGAGAYYGYLWLTRDPGTNAIWATWLLQGCQKDPDPAGCKGVLLWAQREARAAGTWRLWAIWWLLQTNVTWWSVLWLTPAGFALGILAVMIEQRATRDMAHLEAFDRERYAANSRPAVVFARRLLPVAVACTYAGFGLGLLLALIQWLVWLYLTHAHPDLAHFCVLSYDFCRPDP